MFLRLEEPCAIKAALCDDSNWLEVLRDGHISCWMLISIGTLVEVYTVSVIVARDIFNKPVTVCAQEVNIMLLKFLMCYAFIVMS